MYDVVALSLKRSVVDTCITTKKQKKTFTKVKQNEIFNQLACFKQSLMII